MRKISELTAEEAIDLWYECGDALTTIFSNPKVEEARNDDKQDVMKVLCEECRDAVIKVLTWLDPEPVTPFNLFPRLVGFMTDIGKEGTADFFQSASKTEALNASADATETTEENEN